MAAARAPANVAAARTISRSSMYCSLGPHGLSHSSRGILQRIPSLCRTQPAPLLRHGNSQRDSSYTLLRMLHPAIALPLCRSRPRPAPHLHARSNSKFSCAAASNEAPVEEAPDTVVITTPLYYVNAAPHMGSAYPTIAADALARFHRLRGRPVVFVTGTDEHGEKIALAAEAAGKTPRDHCDSVAEEYRKLWTQLDIAYDRFVRTTQERHEAIVGQFFGRCQERGDIYRAQYEGLYCVACEEYKDEKELQEDKSCPIHLKPCQHRSEDNLFFALSNYQTKLEELFEKEPEFVRPSFRKNEVLAWVAEGVRDFSISRATVDWGIPVPGLPEQTIYVWFDALLGYVSALLEEGDPADLEVAASRGWPAHVHIIGKDILRFHAVYWPAMLMSAGLPTPRAVYGHGFLTKDGVKMGKSLGNTLDPQELVHKYGSDAVRFFFLREIEFGRDGDFSQERFVNIVNASLANTVGNLVNRTLGLLRKNCGGVIPVDTATAIPVDHPLRATCEAAVHSAAASYERLDFAAACNALLDAAAAGNVFLEERAPWSKFKKGSEEDKAAAREDLAAVLELARCVAVGLSPVTPRLSAAILEQLGVKGADGSALPPGTSWADATWGGLEQGQQTKEPSPVFKRIEEEASGSSATEPKKPSKLPKQPRKPKEAVTA